jgi:hypothetical protein
VSPNQCGGTAGTVLITAHSPVELLVTDPFGNRTGFDPITDTIYSQIFGSAYYTDSTTEDATPATGATTPAVKNLEMLAPGSGWYLLRATGTDTGTYSIDVRSYDSAGSLTLQTVSGNAIQDVASQFVVNYTATPGSPATVTGPFGLCDINQDGLMSVADVQKIINEALGVTLAVNDLNGDGVVDILDVQVVINAALGLACAAK